MTKHIEPLNRAIPPFGEMTVNDTSITHYMDVIDLPEEPRGQTCMEHLAEGRASDMLGEFIISGCHFPDSADEPMIRTAFVCPGPSILKKCRLKLLQADADGNVITEGRFA